MCRVLNIKNDNRIPIAVRTNEAFSRIKSTCILSIVFQSPFNSNYYYFSFLSHFLSPILVILPSEFATLVLRCSHSRNMIIIYEKYQNFDHRSKPSNLPPSTLCFHIRYMNILIESLQNLNSIKFTYFT